MIHTVKNFSSQWNRDRNSEISILKFCFLYYPVNVGNLISSLSSFSKSSLNIWKFLDHIMLKPNMQDLNHDLASMGDECNYLMVRTFFGNTLLGNLDEDWPFPGLCHCWVFQICWYTACKTLMASSFKTLTSSAGISLALLAAVHLSVHLTSHGRMSGSGWLTTSSS